MNRWVMATVVGVTWVKGTLNGTPCIMWKLEREENPTPVYQIVPICSQIGQARMGEMLLALGLSNEHLANFIGMPTVSDQDFQAIADRIGRASMGRSAMFLLADNVYRGNTYAHVVEVCPIGEEQP